VKLDNGTQSVGRCFDGATLVANISALGRVSSRARQYFRGGPKASAIKSESKIIGDELRIMSRYLEISRCNVACNASAASTTIRWGGEAEITALSMSPAFSKQILHRILISVWVLDLGSRSAKRRKAGRGARRRGRILSVQALHLRTANADYAIRVSRAAFRMAR